MRCRMRQSSVSLVCSFGVGYDCSEPAVKEILLLLDATMHFIIEDIDATHLFIDHNQLERVQTELQNRLAENVFKPPQL